MCVYVCVCVTAGATAEGKDLSLYYGDIKELTTITDSRRYLPSDVYGELVRKCVVCCVDMVIVRTNAETGKKECVLVERASEPAKGLWWWPGGRLLKGESFFDAAKRKAQQETGLNPSDLTPIQV
jgi:8-oxo-dGTP pyrophosphatase MutT (NUDIX family)